MFPTRRDREDRHREADRCDPHDEPKRRESKRHPCTRKTADPNAFELIETIGEGAEGRCELIRRLRDGKTMVCKKAHTLHKSMMEGSIPREVKILQDTLRPHPRIINLLSYDIHKGKELDTYYDYCAGGDLLEQLRPQPGVTSEKFIWHVFGQMAEALAYLHCGYTRSDPTKSGKMPHKWRPVLHCDIKPDNIFLKMPRTTDNPLPDIVLGDFGFAVIGEEDRTGGGAPEYQPPEYPYNTPASDVWALGATIYQMAHGHVPVNFEIPKDYRGTKNDWLTDPHSKRIRALPGIYTSALEQNVMDCLKFHDDERVSAYNLLRHIRRDTPKRRW